MSVSIIPLFIPIHSFYSSLTIPLNFYFTRRIAVSVELCNEIAEFRRWAQPIDNDKILFIDETHLRVNEAPRRTLVASGEQPLVLVDENTQYAARFDMIAGVIGDRALMPIIFSPADREELGVDGINGEIFNDSIINHIAPEISALDRYGIRVVVDRASCHNLERMRESFIEGHCHEVIEYKLLPARSAKRISPLDNSLFHEWKDHCRNHAPLNRRNIVRVMSDEWNNLPAAHIPNHYQHCGLIPPQPLYNDCPCPTEHRHLLL